MLTLGFTLHDKASPRLIRLGICIHVHVADFIWRGVGGGWSYAYVVMLTLGFTLHDKALG